MGESEIYESTNSVKKNQKITATQPLEKKYLSSAIAARLMSVGMKEVKSLKQSVSYLKNLEKIYPGMLSPFYFHKYVKVGGKFFWNPCFPIFYSAAYERFLRNELNDFQRSEGYFTPGVAFLDFATCPDSEYLAYIVNQFEKEKFELAKETYKAFIRWPHEIKSGTLLARFLEKMNRSIEIWMVIDPLNAHFDAAFLKEQRVKGVIFNTPKGYENIMSDHNLLARCCKQANQAGLLIGLNTDLQKSEEEYLNKVQRRNLSLKVDFSVWNYQPSPSVITTQSKELGALKADIERYTIRCNTHKDFSQLPLIHYPDFFRRSSKQKNFRGRLFNYYSFRGSIQSYTVVQRDLFRFIGIPIIEAPKEMRLAQ